MPTPTGQSPIVVQRPSLCNLNLQYDWDFYQPGVAITNNEIRQAVGCSTSCNGSTRWREALAYDAILMRRRPGFGPAERLTASLLRLSRPPASRFGRLGPCGS